MSSERVAPASRRLRRLARDPFLLSVVLALGLFLVGAVHINGFTARYSVMSMLTLASLLGIASCGQTIVVILGGIDLSIPFVIDFADVVAGELNGRGWPFWHTALLVMGVAALFGAVNGLIASVLRLHPLIVTLGTGFALQGGVLVWNGGLSTGTSPNWLTNLVSSGGTTGPIPLPGVVVAWIVIAAVLIAVLHRTVFGRHVYALGANPLAARLSLVRPGRVWAAAFSLSAMFAAVTGILLLGFTGSVYADVGAPYLFATVGAVVIGGTSLRGGSGGYAQTIIGAAITTELTTVLVGIGLSQAMLETALGALVIAVVAVYGREPSVRSRV